MDGHFGHRSFWQPIFGNRVIYTVVISLNPDDKLDEKDSNSPDGKTQQESHPFFFIKV